MRLKQGPELPVVQRQIIGFKKNPLFNDSQLNLDLNSAQQANKTKSCWRGWAQSCQYAASLGTATGFKGFRLHDTRGCRTQKAIVATSYFVSYHVGAVKLNFIAFTLEGLGFLSTSRCFLQSMC